MDRYKDGGDQEVITLLNLSLKRPIVFIDLETTGLNLQSDKVIELTALKIYPNGNEEEKTIMVDPQIPISRGATEVHGMSDQDVKGKPAFRQYAKSLLEFLNDCDLAGFNLIRFDLPLLKNEFAQLGMKLELDGVAIIDAMDIFHRMEPRDLKAAYLKYCGKELKEAHSSSSDVRATVEVLDSQITYYGQLGDSVIALHDFSHPKHPDWLDSEGKILTTPEGPVFGFGKYQGRLLSEIFQLDPEYLNWIIYGVFDDDVKRLAEQATKF